MKISELLDETGSDKNERHLYGSFYDIIFKKIQPKDILEIGVLQGASAMAFEKYGCRYVGVDMNPIEGFEIIEATEPDFGPVIDYCASNMCEFDVIIDDGSHDPVIQREAYKALFKYVRVGGYCVMEDLSVKQWITDVRLDYGASIVDFRPITGHADSCLAYWRK